MTTYVDERLPGGARHRAGFADPVQDAQSVFRAALAALARPTLPQTVTAAPQPPAPLSPEAAAVLLALCDEQTPIWLDAALRTADEVGAWLRFHTGARIVDAVGDALFVVASAPSTTPRLADLSAGTDEEPHRSATLLIDATGATGIGTFTVTGPGVDGSLDWDGSGLSCRLPRAVAAEPRTLPPRSGRRAHRFRIDSGTAPQHAAAGHREQEQLMYVAVKGGEQAIANAHALLAQRGRGEESSPRIDYAQVREQLGVLVSRVMAEGSLYDPDLAAKALLQAQGDVLEAVTLLRSCRTTLPRFGVTVAIDTAQLPPQRRVSATFKDIPGGQQLGANVRLHAPPARR